MRTRYLFLSALCITTLLLAGCEANSMEDETTMLRLDLEPRVDGSTLTDAPSAAYTIGDREVSFSSARIYLSEIVLVRDDGEEIMITGESVSAPAVDGEETITYTTSEHFVLAKHDLGETIYDLGEVPAGVYEGVRFAVGVAGLANHYDPTQVPAGHPLAKQTDRNNHWSWNSGYIFLRLDGSSDLDEDGTVADGEGHWEVHLGTDGMRRVVELDQTFTLEGGEMQDLHIQVDYGMLLENVDFSSESGRVTHTMDNMPLAASVANDLTAAFMLHGIHSH